MFIILELNELMNIFEKCFVKIFITTSKFWLFCDDSIYELKIVCDNF